MSVEKLARAQMNQISSQRWRLARPLRWATAAPQRRGVRMVVQQQRWEEEQQEEQGQLQRRHPAKRPQEQQQDEMK